MEVKKIVEGMTAQQVAEVIDSNFKGLNEEKANKIETDAKLSELDAEGNRNRIYLEDIDVVIAELPVNTTTYMSTFPIVLNAGDIVHITPMLSGITSLDGVYLYYSDGTRKAIYTWGSGKLKVVNIDKKVTSVGFYYSSGTPTTDYIRFHYMGKAAILADIEPRFSSLESAESRLSANQQTIQTDIAAIENTANIVTIRELTEDELVQQSSVRVICDRLISAKRIVGPIITSVIDIAVQYMDINANVLYDSGWTRQTEINTIGYTNAHTLRLIFRNQSAASISKTDVISHITKLSLKEYGLLLQQSDIVGEGNTEYYGKAITFNIMEEKKYCNNVLLHTILNREDITALTSIQSLAIHEGIAVIPKDGTRFVIMNIASGEFLYHGEFPQSHHNNAIQFSNTFYDVADRFPLLLLSSGDYENPSNKAMVLRMSNDYTMTLIKEIDCSLANVQYNGSFVADFSTNRLWLYTFTNGSYEVRENNNVVIYEFALPNIKTSESVTLSKDDILKEIILPVCTMQDAVAYGGKLWFPCSYADYINGFPTSEEGMNDNIILVLNPNNGVIESAIKGVAGLEPQGIDFYNGKMYYTCKNSGVTEIGKTAFRFYEYSFNS